MEKTSQWSLWSIWLVLSVGISLWSIYRKQVLLKFHYSWGESSDAWIHPNVTRHIVVLYLVIPWVWVSSLEQEINHDINGCQKNKNYVACFEKLSNPLTLLAIQRYLWKQPGWITLSAHKIALRTSWRRYIKLLGKKMHTY